MRKKLQEDKDKLANDLSAFEQLKTNERKKIEEEKRRIKRDLNMLEKKEKNREKCSKCEELKTDKLKLDKDFKAKETKLTEEVSKLKDQLKKYKRENQELENENQRLKLKKVNSKVNPVETREPETVVVESHKAEDNSYYNDYTEFI